MAQGLRSRSVDAVVPLACLTLLAACADDPAAPRQQTAPPQPRAVDVAAIADDELVEAVLDECHRRLRGRMQRVTATVAHGELRSTVFAVLPDRVRVQGPDGRFLLRDDDVHRLDERELAPDDERRVRLLAFAVDAAAFGALHRASACKRVDASTFELDTEGGATWRLRLRDGALLPAALGRGEHTATFVDYRCTNDTWVARTLDVPGLGRVDVTFDSADVRWNDDFFAPPSARAPGGDVRMTAPGAHVPTKSAAPTRKRREATRYVVLPDPGDWPARVDAYRPVYAELLRQRQRIAGFPLLWRQDGASWLAVPFRQRDGEAALDAPDDWTIRDLPAGFALEVFPTDGDFDERAAAGERALREELQRRGVTAKGPITTQPWLHLHRGAPSVDDLAAPTVRVAVPIE